MRLLAILILAAFPGAGFAADLHPARNVPVLNPDAAARANCPPISRYEAARRDTKLTPRFLDELPGADLYKAVYRHLGPCNVPIITRYNIGGNPVGSGKH